MQPVFTKDFVSCWIDVERMVGGLDLLEKMRGSARGGIPWFTFLEPDGTAVVDADDITGRNLGCPNQIAEVDAWGKVLAKARLRITDTEIAAVVEAFHEAGERGHQRREQEKAQGR